MKSMAFILVLLMLITFHGSTSGQANSRRPMEQRGLRVKCDGASPGYTLFAPMNSDTTYLINLDGQTVRTWKSDFEPGAWVYLMNNGHLLRSGNDAGTSGLSGGGQGGRFQEFDFDGKLIWDFRYNEKFLPHHDAAVLPNGNILAIVWETRTAEEALRAGRRPGFIAANGIWPDMLIEFEPVAPNGARVVWEWHVWDHLIQNIDSTRENFGDPFSHPERIDLNGDITEIPIPPANPVRDVFHTNSIAYNPGLDQILLSVPTFNEVWIIDHSTTTQQAASNTGGRYGRGGDLLYRWGNPQTYGRGSEADRLLGFQHDANWIPAGRPGEGHIMVFSNRTPIPNGAISKVYELVPPLDAEGHYALPESGSYEPAMPLWTYSSPESFVATYISGAERLINGNTLISSGPQGRIFEVTPSGDIVWEYWSPYTGPHAGDRNSNNSPTMFSMFRVTRISPDHPALKGRDLRPLDPQPLSGSFEFIVPEDGIETRRGDCSYFVPASAAR